MANTNLKFDKAAFKKEVEANVKTLYRKTLDEANQQQIFQAVSYAIKDLIVDRTELNDKIKKLLVEKNNLI